MPLAESFDAVVIGTGQGGKPLTAALTDAGRRTAIVECGAVGGTCVNTGCTPTKTMIASARVAHLARRAADYGVHTGTVSVDLARVRHRKREIVGSFREGNRKKLEENEGIELILGLARFSGFREVTVELLDGGIRCLTADQVFVNAGCRPRVPPIPGLDSVDYLTSTTIMELGSVPEHLLVLGGGFIGLEFAQMMRRFGARVTIIERGGHLAGREDEDVAEVIEQIFRDDGIEILLETGVTSVGSQGNSGIVVRVEAPDGEREIVGSHLLVAAGRTPNTDTLDPEATDIETDERGYIPVNERLETCVPGVYALGDITGAPPFTHTSYDDYRIIRENLLGDGGRSRKDRLLAYTVFTDPQLGRVGLTERQAREKGLDVQVAKLPMEHVARAIEMDETRGFMKAVVDADTEHILGAAILGVEGGEVMSMVQIAMMGDLPYTALRDGVFAHPTFGESLNNLFMAMDD